MEELNPFYVRMLHYGLMIAHNLMFASEFELAKIEIVYLHNMPSLIGETNLRRHAYFWNGERQYYLDCLKEVGDEEKKDYVRMYHEPVWEEMEPVITRLIATIDRQAD